MKKGGTGLGLAISKRIIEMLAVGFGSSRSLAKAPLLLSRSRSSSSAKVEPA
jgi:nitrogen-specific signal transduction histidine kinase